MFLNRICNWLQLIFVIFFCYAHAHCLCLWFNWLSFNPSNPNCWNRYTPNQKILLLLLVHWLLITPHYSIKLSFTSDYVRKMFIYSISVKGCFLPCRAPFFLERTFCTVIIGPSAVNHAQLCVLPSYPQSQYKFVLSMSSQVLLSYWNYIVVARKCLQRYLYDSLASF